MTRPRVALLLLVLGALLIGAGEVLGHLGRDAICDPGAWGGRAGLRRCVRYLYPTARNGAAQLGALAVVAGLAGLALSRLAPERRAALTRRLAGFGLRALAVVSITFATGEIALRVWYWDGISFGAHEGPFVRRFERDFVTNRYEGPSRGPEVEGAKRAGATRILVQGDSITWGQGVKPESALYTSRLLASLRARNPRVEMAVLATGGREIDGHLDQLHRFGAEIDPDVIVYQWFINDIELNKEGRPLPHLPWRGLFFHPVLAAASDFWFFLDYAATQFWPTDRSYVEYIRTDHAPGTANWRQFVETFDAWAAEARSLTPRVLVVLYPRVSPPAEILFPEVHQRVQQLAADQGLESLDLAEDFAELRGDYEKLWASPFDAHPSALAHEIIAKSLERRLLSLWPGVWEPHPEPPRGTGRP